MAPSFPRRLAYISCARLTASALAIFLILSCPLFAQQSAPKALDVIIFRNGDKLSGKLIEATHDGVTFAGETTGTLSLRWNVIDKVSLSKNSLALTTKSSNSASSPSKFTLEVESIEVHDNQLSLVQPSPSPAISVAIEDFTSLRIASSPGVDSAAKVFNVFGNWRGLLQMQDSFTGATQKKYDLAGAVHLARPTQSRKALEHQVTSVTLQADFGESAKPKASPVRTVLYEGLLQQTVYLDDKATTYLFGLADFYHNLSLGMNLQQSYGAGLGWDGHHARHRFGFAADVRYIGEDVYAPGPSVKLAASGLSEYYTYTFSWPKKKPISFFERILFVPAFNESRAYQARGTARLQLPLTPKFSIGLEENDDYLRNSPKGTNQNYSKVSLTLKYSIGAPL